MSVFGGKQELVELFGAGSTGRINTPENCCLNKKCFNLSRIKENLFYYKGLIDSNNCNFKIDTGSDISVLNKSLVRVPRRQYEIKESYIKYPTGEIVPVQFKVIVRVELGKYSLDVPMLVADISDECILGADFLLMINLEKIFDPIFGNSVNAIEFM